MDKLSSISAIHRLMVCAYQKMWVRKANDFLMKLSEIFKLSNVLIEFKEIFDNCEIIKININKELRKLEIEAKFHEIISKSVIIEVASDLKKAYQLNLVKIFTRYDESLFNVNYFSEILYFIEKKRSQLYSFLIGSTAEIDDNRFIIKLKNNGVDILKFNQIDEMIETLILEEFGLEYKVSLESNANKDYIKNYEEKKNEEDKKTVLKVLEEAKNAAPIEPVKKKNEEKNQPYDYRRPQYQEFKLSDISQNSGKVIVTGEVFFVEKRTFSSGDKGALTYFITDDLSSVIVKIIAKRSELDDLEEEFTKGTVITVKGETVLDKYIGDFVVMTKPKDIAQGEKEERNDLAVEKRVELHMHTNMSAVDGLAPVEKLIKRAAKWGHSAVAVTDHGVIHAFPDAYSAAKKAGIKLIYGVECYFVNDSIEIVHGNDKTALDEEFIVFDIETTGFSAKNDAITEIGAVRVKAGKIIDEFSTFVNPNRPIPYNIVELTGITDDMVKNAPQIEEALEAFLNFTKDTPVVAHNAGFDVGFIKQKSYDVGLEFNNTYIDTLELSRTLLKDLKKHKLNIVAEHLGVSLEGHHRAVNDAKALADIFNIFLEMLSKQGIEHIGSINTDAGDDEKDFKKLNSYHAVILVKNKVGLKNLYRLISDSNLKYFYKRPRILKSEFVKYREGLIIGSACEAGELYQAQLYSKPYEEILNIAKFYDYLEIQPVENNLFLVENGRLSSVEEIKKLNKDIVKLAKRLNKPVVATGDVHFLNPQDAVHRAIIMAGHGFKDADKQAPLYFKSTDEMLTEFSYLGKEDCYDVVVKNTNLIADMIDENFEPIPSVKHPPKIDGSEEEIKTLTYNRAYEMYGNPLPQIVEDRIKKELNSIITNGFSVMYLIAQKLVKKSLDDGYLVGSRGSVGSSFVAFLSGITEVNSLCPHYLCEDCKYCEFIDDGRFSSGCDMPSKTCPECGAELTKNGHDIPFETFLGFEGDKEPDIDLNFSGEYQSKAHKYIEELFGEGHVFRAGTLGTIADRNAFGYVKNYLAERDKILNNAEIQRLTYGCIGVKKTTGQHPGGIMIVPKENEIYEFCPIQRPADDSGSDIITTHFDYHKLHDTLLKLDILGHDDPTMLRMLHDLTGLNPIGIPLDDKETMSLFTSPKALKVTEEQINSSVGTFGVPEFGTKFVRQMLEDTKPTTFGELVRISGLSHGTDVWLNNAQDIVQRGIAKLNEAICTRDDIMIYLIHKGMEPKLSFYIMEDVRKGKGLKPEYIEAMKASNIPDWYIDSCIKIKYMFPKAHAVAYVTMAFRIAYYKVHYPLAYYATYFSVRADDFDAEIMARGKENVKMKLKQYEAMADIKVKEKSIITILEMCNEMYERGFSFLPIDLYKSSANKFIIEDNGLRLPFSALKGLGAAAAESVVEARNDEVFFSQEDLLNRTKLSKTHMEIMEGLGVFNDLPKSSQMSLF